MYASKEDDVWVLFLRSLSCDLDDISLCFASSARYGEINSDYAQENRKFMMGVQRSVGREKEQYNDNPPLQRSPINK